jgi:serine/threonine-protein kinase HipA
MGQVLHDCATTTEAEGTWTDQHQMSLNGKRNDFTVDDFANLAATAGLKRGRHKQILDQVTDAVSRWRSFAKEAGVASQFETAIASQHRLTLR